MSKIAFLIPMTSKNRDWKKIEDCYLLQHTFGSFLRTRNNEHKYKFYIGLDNYDEFFDKYKTELINIFNRFGVDIEIIKYKKIKKSHLTEMWNILFKKAYEDGYDYFYQCGDDIHFNTQNWINDCIAVLRKNNNIGVAGPISTNLNRLLLTQSFVSRKHMEIFGYYFPPEILNWYCDDWISDVYKNDYFFRFIHHIAPNMGGEERYRVERDKTQYFEQIDIGKKTLRKYLDKYNNNFANYENDCYYVCSRGLIKSCHAYSNIFQSDINIFTNCEIKPTDRIIYVCNRAMKHFMTETFDKITRECDKSFVLVSGDSDATMYDEILSHDEFNKLINHPKLIHWFCQNYNNNQHPKITSMPIGLDYHTMMQRDTYWGKRAMPVDQEKVIFDIKKYNYKNFYDREIKCYANFHFSMNAKYGYDRRDALKNIDKSLVYYESTQTNRKSTWETQSKYAFVISPLGNGLDCHRTWEALALGCIPIVKKSNLDIMYKDLPVLIVNEWKDIKYELLKDTVDKFKSMTFNYDKLTMQYWKDLIYSKLNIKKPKCVIGGCVKNCEAHLNNVLKNIDKLKSIFEETHIIFYVDISMDNSLKLLMDYKDKNTNVQIILNTEPLSAQRVENIAKGRNKIIEKIYNEFGDYDYFIMMDMDDVCAGYMNTDVLRKHLLNSDDWDCLTFNKTNYYDYWALSIGQFQYSCWHFNEPYIMIDKMRQYLEKTFEIFNSYIECRSAFGGFGIYKLDKFKNCKYISYINLEDYNLNIVNNIAAKNNLQVQLIDKSFDCEHRRFHFDAIKNNDARIRITKDILFENYC